MHGPFYRSAWDNHSPGYFYYTPRHPQPQPEPEPEPIPSPIMRGVPVHRPRPTQSSKRKIVSIPVHGPGPVRGKQTLSESESQSAVRIQKAFRGYVVRKWVRRVAEIKKEVEDIERRMGNAEWVDKITRDERERLKFNETLMNLLFKLDSVRGVDPAVRAFRRAVIRKAVALQESLDKIPASSVANANDVVSRNVANGGADQVVVSDSSGDGTPAGGAAADSTPPASEVADSEPNRGEEDSAVPDLSQRCADEAAEMKDGMSDDVAQENADPTQRELVGADVAHDALESAPGRSGDAEQSDEGDDRTESQVDSSANPESMNQAEENVEEDGIDNDENDVECDAKDEEPARELEKRGEERSRELLERMVEENEKMMRMMAELFERNEKQTSLLSTLSKRVEQLEKAYACEKLRRMKKKK